MKPIIAGWAALFLSLCARAQISGDTSVISTDTLNERTDTATGWKSRIRPTAFFNNEDRIFVGLGYVLEKRSRGELAASHGVQLNYSLNQKAPSVAYRGLVREALGRWDLVLQADFDWIRWYNFYGLGNETTILKYDNDFYRLRTREASAGVGIARNAGRHHRISLTASARTIEVNIDPERFAFQPFNPKYPSLLERREFAGVEAAWQFQKVDDALLPSRGIEVNGQVAHVLNLGEERSITRLSGIINWYLPIAGHLVWHNMTGAQHVGGQPEFYQYAAIGGTLLRGFRRERFWGRTAVHQNNELYYSFPLRWNSRGGFLAFYDVGRVFMEEEDSQTWHSGFGGGIILIPRNRVSVAVLYGISNEYGLLHFRIRAPLRR